MKLYYNKKSRKFVPKTEYFKAVLNGDFTDKITENKINDYKLKN